MGGPYKVPPLNMVMLGVRDLQRSVAFYRDQLGITIKHQFEGFAFLDTGAVSVILSEALAKNSPNIAGATETIFTVDDVRGATEALKGQGSGICSRTAPGKWPHVGGKLQ